MTCEKIICPLCIGRTPREKSRKSRFQIEIDSKKLSLLFLNCQQVRENFLRREWTPVIPSSKCVFSNFNFFADDGRDVGIALSGSSGIITRDLLNQ